MKICLHEKFLQNNRDNYQPAPKYHTKGCSHSTADSLGARTLVFAACEPFHSCEFRASIGRTPFCAILWRSPMLGTVFLVATQMSLPLVYQRQQNHYSPHFILGQETKNYSYTFGWAKNLSMLRLKHQFSIQHRSKGNNYNLSRDLMQHNFGLCCRASVSHSGQGTLDVASRAPRDEGRSCRCRPFDVSY